MKKILYYSMSVLLLIGGIFVVGYVFANSTSDKSIDNNYLHEDTTNLATDFGNNAPELNVFNLQKLSQTKSVPIIYNEDPGSNPPDDYFGVLGNLTYPLKELDISDADEIAVIIRPSPNLKTDVIDAYIACNTEVVRQAKDEFCYFNTPVGTTPNFYVSIYKNGFVVEKNIGIFGIHLSKLGDEFKPVKKTKTENSSTIVCIRNFDEQSYNYTNEFLSLVN